MEARGVETQEVHRGRGRLLTADGSELARVAYEYRIDRRNRVWSGQAIRVDAAEPLPRPAGPGLLETERGERAPVHFRQRREGERVVIALTGRGAPPGE